MGQATGAHDGRNDARLSLWPSHSPLVKKIQHQLIHRVLEVNYPAAKSSLQNRRVGRGLRQARPFAGEAETRGAKWLPQGHRSGIRIELDANVQLSALPRTTSPI